MVNFRMEVQFRLRERRHDRGELVPSGEGSHRLDVRAAAHDAVCLRPRPRQARISARTQVQVLRMNFGVLVASRLICRENKIYSVAESSKIFFLFYSATNRLLHTFKFLMP